jgi:hypothetical protein
MESDDDTADDILEIRNAMVKLLAQLLRIVESYFLTFSGYHALDKMRSQIRLIVIKNPEIHQIIKILSIYLR